MLFLLLLGMVGYILWYVADRRAKMRPAPPGAAKTVAPGKD